MNKESHADINLAAAFGDDQILYALTSFRAAGFKRLLAEFERHYRLSRAPLTLNGQPRRRAPMTGHKGPLNTARAKLFFILFYFKFHPSQDLMGTVFGLSQSQVSRWLRLLTPLVHQALGHHLSLASVRQTSMVRLLIQVPELRRLLAGLAAKRPASILHPGR